MKNSALVLVLTSLASAANALVITPTTDSALMANTILGSGVTINSSSLSYYGDALASGTFTGGLSSIGIESGLLLTTGKATDAAGPNSSGSTSVDNSTGGDANLATLVSGSINDTAYLSFDFTTTGGDLYFDYVFGSEEYNEYVNSSYNDVFGLFVDGINIAVAPNGQPVSINNVNCGNPYSGSGPNCGSFVNNSAGAYDVEYDGFTTVLQAYVGNLSAGVHTMKFAIADVSDSILDSGIFIKAGSFSNTPGVPVPEPSVLLLIGLGLLGLGHTRRKTAA